MLRSFGIFVIFVSDDGVKILLMMIGFDENILLSGSNCCRMIDNWMIIRRKKTKNVKSPRKKRV